MTGGFGKIREEYLIVNDYSCLKALINLIKKKKANNQNHLFND